MSFSTLQGQIQEGGGGGVKTAISGVEMHTPSILCMLGSGASLLPSPKKVLKIDASFFLFFIY